VPTTRSGFSSRAGICYDEGVRLALSLFICLGMSAPAVADVPSDPPVVDAKTKLAGRVLVWADAVLQVESGSATPSVTLGRLRGRMFEVGGVFPAKVIKTRGELVEIELSATPDCAWNTGGRSSELASVRMFVKRTDLAPLVTRRFTKTFKDGSRITLEPGVPVVPDEHGYKMSIDGDGVVVPIPSKQVGFSYAPTKLVVVKAKPRYWLAPKTIGRLGDHEVKIENADTTAASVSKRKERTLFPIRAACIDAVISVPADAVTETELKEGDLKGDVYGGLVGVPDRWVIPPRTALRTAGGRVVASTSAEVEVGMPFMYGNENKPICKRFELGLEPHAWRAPRLVLRDALDRTIELCVPADSVRHDPPP
jgi:hypothetical protein